MKLQDIAMMIALPLGMAHGEAKDLAQQPNILYIMADDHSAATIGAYATHLKGVVQTPNIDRLAKEGARFTNVQCVNALCAPSRASIITGLYSHQHGVYTLREDLNTAEIPSVAKLLKGSGYQTAVFGKWHVHGDNLHGYDDYAVSKSQGSYFNPRLGGPDGKKVQGEGYASDFYTQLSLDWLDKRDKEKPFFLMTHFKAVHGPWEYAARHKDLYKDTVMPEPPTLLDDYANRDPSGVANTTMRVHKAGSKSALSTWFQTNKKGKPGKWPTGQLQIPYGLSDREITKLVYQKYIKDYLRCVKGVDEGVGRLLKKLEDEGILDNTVVVYTSDQGMYVGEHGFFDKRLGLNPALQMPLIIRYPKSVKQGVVLDELINNVDYAETLLDMGGVKVPDSMQGKSFWPLTTGTGGWDRTRSIYTFYSNGVPKHYGIVTKEYKLLKYMGRTGELLGVDLFDRKKDPDELQSLAKNPEYAAVLENMESELAEEIQSIGLAANQLPGKFGGDSNNSGPKVKKASNKKQKTDA